VFDPRNEVTKESFSVTDEKGKQFCITCFDVMGQKLVAGNVEGKIGIWDLTSKEREKMWKVHKQKVSKVLFVPEDKLIYSVGHDGYFYATSYAFEEKKVVHGFISCTCPLSCLATEPGRPSVVYIGSWDGHVKKIDLQAKSCIQVLRADQNGDSPIRALCIAPAPPPPPGAKKPKKKKGQAEEGPVVQYVLVVAHGIGQILSFDLATNTMLVSSYLGHKDVVNDLCVHNNQIFSAADDKSVRLFDLAKGTPLDMLSGHKNGAAGCCGRLRTKLSVICFCLCVCRCCVHDNS